MGLLAVMGPSRKLHFGLPAFRARSLAKTEASVQNLRISCSPRRKSAPATFSNMKATTATEVGRRIHQEFRQKNNKEGRKAGRGQAENNAGIRRKGGAVGLDLR